MYNKFAKLICMAILILLLPNKGYSNCKAGQETMPITGIITNKEFTNNGRFIITLEHKCTEKLSSFGPSKINTYITTTMKSPYYVPETLYFQIKRGQNFTCTREICNW